MSNINLTEVTTSQQLYLREDINLPNTTKIDIKIQIQDINSSDLYVYECYTEVQEQKIEVPFIIEDLITGKDIEISKIKQLKNTIYVKNDNISKVISENLVKVNNNYLIAHWMKTALAEIGIKEIKGSKHEPRVLEYHKSSASWLNTDEIPWCASFVNWVMEKEGYTTISNSFRAKSWKNFGKEIKKPVYGAIAIKSRKGGGHVAFIIGKSKDDKYLYVLGGNQNN
ncbi:MAG: TIGR02594 family protein, partial [Arcobacter sp.]|nr:TIGR02594 family protein [Arcobacter sp.]